jgi:RNA polymerase sigma factor (sigma-70 family)
MTTPSELLQRAASGDEAAWHALVQQYQRLIHATIRSFRLDATDAEDLFQETFLRLHRHAPRLRDGRALTRWLIVTTRNLCLDHLARTGRARHEPLDPDEESPEPLPIADLIHLERAQIVREEVHELSARCRDLLWLLYFEQEKPDYHAAAAQFGMPVGSVGPNRIRCLEELLRRLRKRGIDG